MNKHSFFKKVVFLILIFVLTVLPQNAVFASAEVDSGDGMANSDYDPYQPEEDISTGDVDDQWQLEEDMELPEIKTLVAPQITTLASPNGAYNTDNWSLTITNITPGKLEETANRLIPHGNKAFSVFDFKVSGTSLNEADFKFMKGMVRCVKFDLSGLTSQSTIPKEALNGLAAAGEAKMETVILPSSVRTIGAKAFANNAALKSINISNITTFEDSAFENCIKLPLTQIGAGSVTVGDRAFQNCRALGEIDITNITYMGAGAFFGCSNFSVKDGKMNRSITVLNDSVFFGCEKLNNIDISNILVIGNYAFSKTAIGTKDLSKVISIGKGAFSDAKNFKILGDKLNSKITEIDDFTFSGCTSLDTIDLSNMVSVGSNAFYNCTALKNIVSTSKITSIGNSAFYGCTLLGEVDLSKATYIGQEAFALCPEFHLKAGTKLGAPGVTLGAKAFNRCPKIGEVDFSNVSKFGSGLFSGDGYSPFVVNITIKPGTKFGAPGAVIDSKAFYNVSQINNLDLSNISSIGTSAFYRCKLHLSDNSTVGAPGASIFEKAFEQSVFMTEADLSNVKEFGDSAFLDSSVKTKSGTKLGMSGATIGSKAFSRCSVLKDVDLSNVAKIGVRAFENSKALTFAKKSTVGMPGVTIGDYAFNSCIEISRADLSNAVSIRTSAFSNCNNLWLKTGSTLGAKGVIIGTNAFSKTAIDEVDLSNASYIAERAFEGCTSLTLTDGSTLGQEGVEIFRNAFAGCTSLEEVNLSNAIFIHESAFQNCIKMKLVDGDASNSKLEINGAYIFENCADLGSLTLPAKTKKLGVNVFAGAKDFTLTLNYNGVVSIQKTTFVDSSDVVVFVPLNLLPKYENDTTWEYAVERLGVTLAGYVEAGTSPGSSGNGSSSGSGRALETSEEKKELMSFSIGSDEYSVDGKSVPVDKNLGEPYIDESNAMVPLRTIAELLGYDVSWSQGLKQISVDLGGGTIVQLQANKSEIYVNGVIVGHLLDASGRQVTPVIKNGRTYLPVRALFVDVLGFDTEDLQYDPKTLEINLFN